MREFGLESLSSSQVSRAAKLLDGELDAWRNRPLGEIRYLLLDARYEKVREGGVVRDAAVLSVIGIGPDQRRRVLGVSCALSEAEVHWRAFLEPWVLRRQVPCASRSYISALAGHRDGTRQRALSEETCLSCRGCWS